MGVVPHPSPSPFHPWGSPSPPCVPLTSPMGAVGDWEQAQPRVPLQQTQGQGCKHQGGLSTAPTCPDSPRKSHISPIPAPCYCSWSGHAAQSGLFLLARRFRGSYLNIQPTLQPPGCLSSCLAPKSGVWMGFMMIFTLVPGSGNPISQSEQLVRVMRLQKNETGGNLHPMGGV